MTIDFVRPYSESERRNRACRYIKENNFGNNFLYVTRPGHPVKEAEGLLRDMGVESIVVTKQGWAPYPRREIIRILKSPPENTCMILDFDAYLALSYIDNRYTKSRDKWHAIVEPALEFDRSAAFGMRLAVPAGTAVRFEPGESKEVTLCEFGGTGELGGLNSLTDGSRHAPAVKEQALRRARERGFRGA